MRAMLYWIIISVGLMLSGFVGFELGKQSSRMQIVSGTLVMPPLNFLHEFCPRNHLCSMSQRYAELPEENNTEITTLQADQKDDEQLPNKSEKP